MFRATFLLGPALAVSLAGCTGLRSGGVLPPGTTDQIQIAAMNLCAFLPTALTIASILNKNTSGLQAPADIASAICAAVLPVQPRGPAASVALTLDGRGPFIPRVANVPVEGRFVTR